VDLLALATPARAHPEPQALAGKILGLLFFNPSLRTLASFQAGMARLGGTSFVDHARPGHVAAGDAPRRGDERRGGGARPRGHPGAGRYCDALGIRAFAEGKTWRNDLAETQFRRWPSLWTSR
jgi:N-acetylornithine carbamoyltransferase